MSGLEIELKAALSADDARSLEAELDRRWGRAPPARKLTARYYDSEDQRLAAKRIALRVRAQDGSLVQTVKAGRTMLGGFHQASEIEAPVSSWQPAFDSIGDPAIRTEVEAALDGAPLALQFETDVRRQLWVVQHDHGLVEVALDRGEIRAGELRDPVLEFEFELLEGSPEAVFELAADLLGGTAVLLDLPSKAGRGQALRRGKAWRPGIAGGKPGTATAGETGEGSWGRALATLAPAISTNLALLATSEEPEVPHQLRVALRRLRSALRLHRPLLDEGLARALADQARDIGRIVGELRDFDVQSEALGLSELLFEPRTALRKRVHEALGEARATAFAIRLLGLAAIGGWKKAEAQGGVALQTLLSRAFNRLWARASALGDRLSTLEDEDQHELRKNLKKLRYLLEYAEKNSETKSFISKLKKLQEELGILNDIITLSSWDPHLSMPLREKLEAARRQRQAAILPKADQALGRACRYWRDLRKLVPPLSQHPAP